jgi:hypothetical protein
MSGRDEHLLQLKGLPTMTCFAQFRKTLGLTLLACALTPPALLASQVAGTSPAHASINVVPPPLPVDGTWSALLGPITTVTVTRQQAEQGGQLLTRFVVEAFHGTVSSGTGTTPWRLLGRYDQGSVSVTITGPCTTGPVCPKLSTDLRLSTTRTAPAFITVTNPHTTFAVLNVLDHRLTGDVSWVESMSHP